jgi:hypothetical protein
VAQALLLEGIHILETFIMKKLSDNLKQMLNGLAHQCDGEFLPMQDKMSALGVKSGTKNISPAPPKVVKQMAVNQRIALITDGRGLGAPLNYVIDACQNQEAKIDLLTHGTTDAENITGLENRVKEAGFVCNRIQLGTKAVDNVLEYINNHPGLVFMVAMPDDVVAKKIMDDVIPKQSASIPVPLVLIDDPTAGYPAERCA